MELGCFLLASGGTHRRCHSFQPDLPPVGIDGARTKHAAAAVARLTDDGIEDDAGAFHLPHFAGPFVENFVDALQDLIGAAAVWDHFGVPPEAAILTMDIHSSQNFLVRFYTHELTGLEIECGGRSRLPLGNASKGAGKQFAAAKEVKGVVQPTHCAAETDAGDTEVVVGGIE